MTPLQAIALWFSQQTPELQDEIAEGVFPSLFCDSALPDNEATVRQLNEWLSRTASGPRPVPGVQSQFRVPLRQLVQGRRVARARELPSLCGRGCGARSGLGSGATRWHVASLSHRPAAAQSGVEERRPDVAQHDGGVFRQGRARLEQRGRKHGKTCWCITAPVSLTNIAVTRTLQEQGQETKEWVAHQNQAPLRPLRRSHDFHGPFA